jgi:hypothetical protein
MEIPSRQMKGSAQQQDEKKAGARPTREFSLSHPEK